MNIAGSGAAADIEMPVGVAVPGAHALAAAETVADADLARLTIPLPSVGPVPHEMLDGNLVIDKVNY